ncbi:MAG: hypothetical protein ACJ77B_12085 [Chloroflexota bacterium]
MDREGLIRLRAAGLPLLVVLALVLVTACAGETPATARPTARPASTPAAASNDTDVASDAPTDEPSVDPGDEPSVDPGDDPSVDPGTDPDLSPEPSDAAGYGATACTGTDDNRLFFETVASKVHWDVYCAVLPAGWHVVTGSYRLAGGGKVEIAYKGPGGARIELHEGAFCTDSNGCVPDGVERDRGQFGDRDAQVFATPDGAVSVVADRGEQISWVALATGVAESDVRDYLSSLAMVAPAP